MAIVSARDASRKFCSFIEHRLTAHVILASESSQTQLNSDHMNICTFMQLPAIGSYVMSACKKMACRVLRYAPATACGQRLIVVFLADPTPVQKENTFGAKGVAIDVHHRECASHIVDEYYLSSPKGYKINATLTK